MNTQEELELAWKARLELEKMGNTVDYERINSAKNYLERILAALWLRKNNLNGG